MRGDWLLIGKGTFYDIRNILSSGCTHSSSCTLLLVHFSTRYVTIKGKVIPAFGLSRRLSQLPAWGYVFLL